MQSVSISYALKWRVINAPDYCITSCRKMVNVRTGRILKRCYCGGSEPEAKILTRALLSVAKPVVVRVLVAVAAPTVRLVPIVAALVTSALLSVAKPLVPKVLRFVTPVTSREPPRVVASCQITTYLNYIKC